MRTVVLRAYFCVKNALWKIMYRLTLPNGALRLNLRGQSLSMTKIVVA